MIEFLSAWYNWIFLAPLLTATMMVMVEIFFGGISEVLGTAIDFDIDMDLDVDMDLDIDIDHDIDHDFSHLNFFGWLGVGKVPITTLVELLGISFGGTGLILNATVSTFFPWFVMWMTFPVILVGSTLVSIFITKKFGTFLTKIMPSDSTGKKPTEYVGEMGVTLNTLADSAGQVRIDGSTVLIARRSPNLTKKIERDTKILVVAYDTKERIYIVEPMYLQGERPYNV